MQQNEGFVIILPQILCMSEPIRSSQQWQAVGTSITIIQMKKLRLRERKVAALDHAGKSSEIRNRE